MTTTAPPMTRRVMSISPLFTVLDNWYGDPSRSVQSTPSDVWSAGLGALLDRVAEQFGKEGVVVLDRAATSALKLPVNPAESTTAGLDDARAAGWLHGKPGPWTAFYGTGRPTIIVGLSSWPEFYRAPVTFAASSVDTVYRLSMWHELTGSAWRGTPGVAGLTVMRATMPLFPLGTTKKLSPSWRNLENPEPGELPMLPEQWSRPQTTRYAHGYDVTRMYLAALQGCEHLSPWALKHTGRRRFDPSLAGWWEVELGPWNDDRIPAPAGYGDTRRWVTTPTLALLHELVGSGGPFQSFEVIDSFTAPGKRVLRRWADTLESAYQTAAERSKDPTDPFGMDQDAAAVGDAVKSAFREAWGLLNRPGNPIFRPDWHFGGLAQGRSNLWRRMWKVGQAEDRWPLEINTDNVWYGSDEKDPEQAKPAGIPLERAQTRQRDVLGTFKIKGTRERGKA